MGIDTGALGLARSGRLDLVRRLACSVTLRRADFQNQHIRLNATWANLEATALPDGDAEFDLQDFSDFVVPDYPPCAGAMKPDVGFFGENVPRDQVALGIENLEQADAMAIVGSSLALKVEEALKVEDRCETALSFPSLTGRRPNGKRPNGKLTPFSLGMTRFIPAGSTT